RSDQRHVARHDDAGSGAHARAGRRHLLQAQGPLPTHAGAKIALGQALPPGPAVGPHVAISIVPPGERAGVGRPPRPGPTRLVQIIVLLPGHTWKSLQREWNEKIRAVAL